MRTYWKAITKPEMDADGFSWVTVVWFWCSEETDQVVRLGDKGLGTGSQRDLGQRPMLNK